MQRSGAGGKADASGFGMGTDRAGMVHSTLERRSSSSSLSKGKAAVSISDADNAASISTTTAVASKADLLREAALSLDIADPELDKIGEGSILDQEPPKTAAHMVKNTGLCSFCFGLGMSVLFIHVGTTTLAAKEFQSTAAATLPFGENLTFSCPCALHSGEWVIRWSGSLLIRTCDNQSSLFLHKLRSPTAGRKGIQNSFLEVTLRKHLRSAIACQLGGCDAPITGCDGLYFDLIDCSSLTWVHYL